MISFLNLVQNKNLVKNFLETKNFMVEKILGSKNFWVKKMFGLKKNVWVKKNLGQINIFGCKSCLGQNKILGQNFFWDCKNLGSKSFLIQDQGISEITWRCLKVLWVCTYIVHFGVCLHYYCTLYCVMNWN